MSKTTRIIENVVEFLDGNINSSIKYNRYLRKKARESGPANSHEILDFYNSAFSHGTFKQQLNNVLGKERCFVNVGTIKARGITTNYSLAVWASEGYVSSRIPGWEQGDPTDLVFQDYLGSQIPGWDEDNPISVELEEVVLENIFCNCQRCEDILAINEKAEKSE